MIERNGQDLYQRCYEHDQSKIIKKKIGIISGNAVLNSLLTKGLDKFDCCEINITPAKNNATATESRGKWPTLLIKKVLYNFTKKKLSSVKWSYLSLIAKPKNIWYKCFLY